jgi:type VI secretion system secreted protein VgrG
VLGDTPGAHAACAPAGVRFHWGALLDEDVVTGFAMEQEIRPGKFALTDYNFTTPKVPLLVSVDGVVGDKKLDLYDYPGEYQKIADGQRLVRLRIEEEETPHKTANGQSGCAQFVGGHTFTLSEHRRRDLNGTYVLLEVSHHAVQNGYRSGADDSMSYANTFTCFPVGTFRPPRLTPRPVVQGSQTAEVVGVAGEEIFTDKYGRVKVQFHWDREGKRNENSSCWIRVSQPWAGKGWGSVSIPRIGQEVIVDFLEGDPDQPIVIGRVYNGEQMPPYALPAGGVVSGVKSNSTKGGGGYNEIALDDTKGTELIRIHGQYDLETVIEHDRKETIKHDDALKVGNHRSKNVANNETVAVGGNRQASVQKNETLSVGGNRNQSVSKNEAIDVGENRTQSVGKKESVSIGDDRTQEVAKNDKLEVGKALTVTAGDSITIATGDASITMKKSGEIVIKGKDIKIEGSGKIAVKASSEITIKGSKVSTN